MGSAAIQGPLWSAQARDWANYQSRKEGSSSTTALWAAAMAAAPPVCGYCHVKF